MIWNRLCFLEPIGRKQFRFGWISAVLLHVLFVFGAKLEKTFHICKHYQCNMEGDAISLSCGCLVVAETGRGDWQEKTEEAPERVGGFPV